MKPKKKLVRGTARQPVARPQPPMKDARTKRDRDRSTQKRNAVYRSMRDDG